MWFYKSLSIILLLHFISVASIFATESSCQETFYYIDQKKWDEALASAKKSGNQALQKIVISQKLLDTSFSNNTFEEAIRFLKANPSWPQSSNLKEKAEAYINQDTDAKLIIEWFSNNPPKTGNGYKFYAQASNKLVKDADLLVKNIKNGWKYGEFTISEQEAYFANYKKYLTEEDHIKKIDYLLWQGNTKQANKLMSLINDWHKKTFKAQIAIMLKDPNADKIFASILPEHYTSGLLYHYLKMKQQDETTKDLVAIMLQAPRDEKHSHEWWRLKHYYARNLIKQKDFESAYKIVKNHYATQKEDYVDAEWLAGWLAFRFLNKTDLAKSHFEKFYQSVKQPISLARGAYWLGRLASSVGDKDGTRKWYKEASKFSYTFYGQLASIELKQTKLILPSIPKPQHHHHQALEKNDIITAAKLLIKHGKPELAHIYVKAAINEGRDPCEVRIIADMIRAQGNPYYMVETAKTASQNHIFLKEYAFPTPYKITKPAVEAPFAYAIIRQESVFNQYAISSANAMGLMQLIKPTACNTAKSLRLKCDISKLTKDPQYNIKLGSTYLKQMVDKFNGSYLLAIPAYNGGDFNVKKWLDIYGDPRKMKNLHDIIDWVEMIPFYETRNYVQRILENLQVYRAILTKDNTLKLAKDLTR